MRDLAAAAELAERAFETAPTLLESMFWGALCGAPNGWELYFKELEITDLRGPGYLTEDFVGEP